MSACQREQNLNTQARQVVMSVTQTSGANKAVHSDARDLASSKHDRAAYIGGGCMMCMHVGQGMYVCSIWKRSTLPLDRGGWKRGVGRLPYGVLYADTR